MQVSEAGIAILRIVTAARRDSPRPWHKVVQGWQSLTAGSDWTLLHDTLQLGFPLPGVFAALAALSQFVGGWLVATGAWTRVAVLLVASTMFTVLVCNLQTGGPDAQLAGLYGLVTGAFVLAGGGRRPIDRQLERTERGSAHAAPRACPPPPWPPARKIEAHAGAIKPSGLVNIP